MNLSTFESIVINKKNSKILYKSLNSAYHKMEIESNTNQTQIKNELNKEPNSNQQNNPEQSKFGVEPNNPVKENQIQEIQNIPKIPTKIEPSLLFDRQMRIKDWNQEKISQEVALLLGVGGLGSSVAITLCRLGIKKLFLVDYDVVDVHNLNRQVLYGVNDVGKLKAECAKKNLEFHNVNNAQIEIFCIDALANWEKIIELAKQSTVVFNMIDYGDHFDLAVQSLCLNLKIPVIMGGTFSNTLTVDMFYPDGGPCLLCLSDGVKNSVTNQIKPSEILKHKDLRFLPKNDNPVGQSSSYLCITCANCMVSLYINQLFGDPDFKNVQRVIFYVNSFEAVNFPAEKNVNCPFCSKSKLKKKKK